jgi:hypothetical protein
MPENASKIADRLAAVASGARSPESTALSLVLDLSSDDAYRLALVLVLERVGAYQRAKALRVEQAAQATRKAAHEAYLASPEVVAARRRIDEEHMDRMDAVQDRFWKDMSTSIERFQAEIKMEWTTELLASRFALPDGTQTTWGAATVEQHEARRGMFAANVLANAEGAIRHDQAIAALRESGASTLAEMMAG